MSNAPLPGVPALKRRTFGADLECWLTADATGVRLCLHRRSPSEASSGPEAFHETAASIVVPLHLAPLIAEDLMTLARRAAIAKAYAPR